MESQTEIEQITKQTNYLLAEHLYTQMNPQKFVNWAVSLLQTGVETESILILAGLDNSSREEIEAYFWKCVDDLGLQLRKSDADLLGDFVLYVAASVLTNKIEPKEALKMMSNILRESDYSSKYIQFYYLDEDIDCLNYDSKTLFNSFRKTDNIDEIILEEFKLFLEFEKMNLDEEHRDFAFCHKCQTIGKPILKTKRNWIGKVASNYLICLSCKSKELEHFFSQKGRRLIINELMKTKAI